MNEEQLIAKLLKVLEENILPLTKIEVKRGNKIFGAAILKKSDLNLVVAGTNQETHNPLWHGEISCLNSYWALPKNKRVPTKDCIFFSTHEPCSLCLSAITWSGFDNFYYFFSYQDSRDKFQIPHDLKILEEVFQCPKGAYRKNNGYWDSYSLIQMIDKSVSDKKADWEKKIAELNASYKILSQNYQQTEQNQNIPLG